MSIKLKRSVSLFFQGSSPDLLYLGKVPLRFHFTLISVYMNLGISIIYCVLKKEFLCWGILVYTVFIQYFLHEVLF